MTMDIKKYEMLAQVIENSMTKEIRDQSVKSVPKNSPLNYHSPKSPNFSHVGKNYFPGEGW